MDAAYFRFQCHLFDFRYVRLPYSICNVIDGIARYDIIQTAISKLLEPLKTYKQIEVLITDLFSHMYVWATVVVKY